MPDTLSPLSVNDTIANATLDNQRIMLAEMGIPLWVSHATPVQTIDLTQFEQKNFTQQNEVQNDVSQANFIEQNLIEKPVLIPSPLQEIPIDLAKKLAISSNNDELTDVQKPLENAISKIEHFSAFTYSLACMQVNDWVLLADNQYLSHHPDELQLWQSMAQGMNAEQKILNFPIINANLNQPVSYQMNDRNSAQMTFIGFLHAQVANGKIGRIGALSPLPEVIEDTDLTIINIASIQRLPYLSEMLADPRQKRQLWELIKK